MKKVFLLLCSIVVIVLCFSMTGCQEEAPKVYPTDEPPMEGVSIEFVSAVLEGDTPYINVKWINNAEYSIYFVSSATIFKDNDGSWELLGSISHQEKLQGLDPGQSKEFKYMLNCDGVVTGEKYKVEAIFNIVNPEAPDTDTITMEFEL